MAKKTITVEGFDIRLVAEGAGDYISLTDIDQKFEGNGRHIENWMRNQNTIEYLATWETLHNPDFNSMQLHGIKEEVGLNRFLLSIKKWVEATGATGVKASAGRFGGTFAHPDIAFHFCLWLSPTFQLYVAKEFQRIKTAEAAALNQEWTVRRMLSKVNFRLHTEAVKSNLIERWNVRKNEQAVVFASEADLLNLALFGTTAKEWRELNPDLAAKNLNIRDTATLHELTVLSNLESYNSILLEKGVAKEKRLDELHRTAQQQLRVFEEMNQFALEKLQSPNLRLNRGAGEEAPDEGAA